MEAARRLDVDLTVASDHDSVFSLSQPERLLTLDFSDPVPEDEDLTGLDAPPPASPQPGLYNQGATDGNQD